MSISTLTTMKNFKIEDITHRPEEPEVKIRGFESVSLKSIDYVLEMMGQTANVFAPRTSTLPKPSVTDLGGYDFYLPLGIEIPPFTTVLVWTNVRAYHTPKERLFFTFKKYVPRELGLDVDIADLSAKKEYEGNIGMGISNSTNVTRSLSKGTKIVQAIFIPCLLIDTLKVGE